jgi:hypothetical protein
MEQEIVVTDANAETRLERQIIVYHRHMKCSNTTFHMLLQNVSDTIVRSLSPVQEVQPLLTLVSDFPNAKNIVAGPDPVDPVLQKELDSVNDLLLNNTTADIPFTPYRHKRRKQAKQAR